MLLILLACISPKRQANSAAHVELAAAYMTEDAAEACIQAALRATDLDRRNVEAWHTLGLCTMKRGAYEESEKAFKRALRLEPDSAAVLLNYAYLLQNLDRNEEAIELLEHAREDLTYRQPAKVLNNLGWAYLEEGRPNEAVGALEEAVLRQPNFCGALYNLGLAYSEIDEDALAIERLAQIELQCPGVYPEATLLQGMLLIEQGRVEEGAGYLALVIQEHPGTPQATEAARQLDAVGMN